MICFLQSDLLENPTNQTSSNRGMTDASNTQSTLSSKLISTSTRPSITNNKENLPAIDKQHRPSTAAAITPITNDQSLVNSKIINGAANSLLASGSIDTATTNNNAHVALKVNTTDGPPASNTIPVRTNTTADKFRTQTVRLPNSVVRRREMFDLVQNDSGSIRKVEPSNINDRTKPASTSSGEKYVFKLFVFFCIVSRMYVYALLILVKSLKVACLVLLRGLLELLLICLHSICLSSFDRTGNESSSTSTSQALHHMTRGPLRETFNPKSASLSVSGTSSAQQQQTVTKIPEKSKYAFSFKELSKLNLPLVDPN